MFEIFLASLVTFFVVIDPPGVTPMFASLTQDMPPAWRRRMAWKSIAVASFILFGFAFGGEWVLEKLHVSLDAFRIAGGLLLFLIALDMLFETRTRRREARNEFTGTLAKAGVTISMDGRGRCMDNIFIERLWRSLKYEAVYLHELTDGFVAERVIAEWINFYSSERPHSSLDGLSPEQVYNHRRPMEMMDKARALPTVPQAQQQQKRLNSNQKLAA